MRGTFTRCNRLAPGVAEARLVREAVGLRPCRRGGVTISLYFVESCSQLITVNDTLAVIVFVVDVIVFVVVVVIVSFYQVRLSQGSDIGSGLKVVHNYGHGGSGVTLSWGCAGQVGVLFIIIIILFLFIIIIIIRDRIVIIPC